MGMIDELRRVYERARDEVEVYRRVLGDPRTPRAAKWLLGGAVAYLVSPIDLIPDAIPVLGQMDDLAVVGLLVQKALDMVPEEVLREHRRRIARERAERLDEGIAGQLPSEAQGTPTDDEADDDPGDEDGGSDDDPSTADDR